LTVQFSSATAHDSVFDALCPLQIDRILLRGVFRARLAIDQLEVDRLLGESVPEQLEEPPPILRQTLVDDGDAPQPVHSSLRTLSVSAMEWFCGTSLL